jgi:hypothetical protein
VDIDSRQVLGEPEGDSPSAVQSLLGGVNSENRNSPLPVQSLLGGVNRENPRWQWQGEPAYFGWGLVGFGRVGVLGFNPDAVTGAAAAGRQRLWRQCINRLMPHRELMPAGGEDQGETRVRSRLPMDNVDQNSMHLHGILQHLMQIRQLRLFSGWVVVGMLGALALLIGPVDYFLLKRLNRQPWTHVTMVCYLALFTLGAYIGVSQFRAGNSQVRAVTVTDAIQGQTAWTTTYAGIFASQGGAYAFHPAAADGWWRDLSTTNDNWYSQPGLADRTLDCWQGDGACTPGALSIRVWTMQCMIGEWPCHKLPLKVRAWGQNGDVQVQVENLADTSVEIVALAGSGESWAKVIPAHESSKSILSGLSSGHDFDQSGPSGKLLRYPDWVPDQKDSPSGFAHAQGAPSISQAALHTGGCGQRLEAMAGMLDKGRVIVIACYKDSPMPFDVPGRQLDKSHLEYVRILTNIEEVK